MSPSHLGQTALFWGGLPVFAAQGLWVRGRTVRLPEAEGESAGTAGVWTAGQRPLQLLALGDSIIAGVGVTHAGETLPVQLAQDLSLRCRRPVSWNRCGRNGADSGELAGQLSQALSSTPSPDIVLVSIGVNDATGLTRISRFLRSLESLRRQLYASSPDSRLVLAAVPPLECFPLLPDPLRRLLGLRAAQLNQVSAHWASQHRSVWRSDMPFVPGPERFSEDGFHPNADACKEWAGYLAERGVEKHGRELLAFDKSEHRPPRYADCFLERQFAECASAAPD